MTNILCPPTRFVSIHGHTDFSPYDGFGHPAQHINFCLNNQLDGWALTDHGNGNGLAHAHAHAKKIIGNGQKFRQLFGVEFYFVPSLENWRKGKVISKAEKDGTRLGLGDDAGLVVEDVGESRIDNGLAAIGRRYHLVVVAKNAIGSLGPRTPPAITRLYFLNTAIVSGCDSIRSLIIVFLLISIR